MQTVAEPMQTLAERLKEARLDAKLTQKQLAIKAGCGQSLIGNLESGRNTSSFAIPRIAEALGVNAVWLSHGKGPRRPAEPTAAPALAPQIIDAAFLYECTQAVGEWLSLAPRHLDKRQKLEMACYLYEMFIDDRSGGRRQMLAFLDRWLEFAKRADPGGNA